MRFRLLTLILLSTFASAAVPLELSPGEPVLLLDSHTVAGTSNVTQRFHPAERHPGNPVLTRTEAWEGTGPYVWGTRLLQDEPTKQFHLYYIAYDYAGNFYRWGLATSADGLKWNKPNLAVESYNGKPSTNLLPLGPHGEKGARSIARDPRPTTPADRRYLGIRFTYSGELTSYSPDGIHWTEHPQSPCWFVPSDIIHVMFDARRNRFIAYYKVWELAGTELLPDGKERPFLAHVPTFTDKKLSNDRTSFEAPVITFRPPNAATVDKRTFILRSGQQGKDDGGGTSLSGAWTAKRVQAFAESDDGLHWRNEHVLLRADAKDPPTANIQYMFVIPYGHYYLAFLTLHDESGHFRIHLAHSSDGLAWTRPTRTPWLDHGPKDSFDSGMVLGPTDPILTDKQMLFPYGGFPITHDSTRQNWQAAIGLATTRLDAFSSWQAGGKPGHLTTQPFLCTGDLLQVNANAAGGSMLVEVQDEQGRPITGYESSACTPVQRDTLNHPTPIHWATRPGLDALKGKLIQLRFTLTNSTLYAFRISTKESSALPFPRATN